MWISKDFQVGISCRTSCSVQYIDPSFNANANANASVNTGNGDDCPVSTNIGARRQ
jgi:hypothetical protein